MNKQIVIYINNIFDGHIYAKCRVKNAKLIHYELLKDGQTVQRITTERSFVCFEVEGNAEYQIVATVEFLARSEQKLSSRCLNVPPLPISQIQRGQRKTMKGGHQLYRNVTEYSLDILFEPDGLERLLSADLSKLPLYAKLKETLSFTQTFTSQITTRKAFSRFRHLYRMQHVITDNQQLITLASELETLDYVIYCSVTPRKLTPPTLPLTLNADSLSKNTIDPDEPTPDFTSYQTYLEPGKGMNVREAWKESSGSWVQTHHIDAGYYEHEDLSSIHFIGTGSDYSDKTHGTACLGCIAASDNGFGVVGVAFGSDCYAYTGIDEVVTIALPGDTVSISIAFQSDDYLDLPVIANKYWWDIIRSLAEYGVVVAPAAGNSDIDLGNTDLMDDYGDAGNLLAGACSSKYGTRLDFSNYNHITSLVNSLGGNVTTTGGDGNLQSEDGTNYRDYTSRFGGTSSASPLSSSALALIQSYTIDTYGVFIDPWDMRRLLYTTGYKEALGEGIGVRPDVYHALRYVDILMQGGVTLTPPIVDNLQNDEIVLSALTEYALQVIARVIPLQENMVVTLYWLPSNSSGVTGPTFTIEHIADAADVSNGQVVFNIPIDEQVTPYLGGSAVVYYHVDNQFSEFVSINITRQAADSLPGYHSPTIIQEQKGGEFGVIENGVVHYDADLVAVTVIPYLQGGVLASKTLIWRCYNIDDELVDIYTYTVSGTGEASNILIPSETYVVPYQGCKVEATFTYLLYDGSEYIGPTTAARVSSPEPVRITMDNAHATIIDLSEQGESMTARLKLPGNGIVGVEGDVATLTVQGYSYSGFVTTLPNVTFAISSDDVLNGELIIELLTDIYMTPFNNGAITLTYTLERAGSLLLQGPLAAYAIDPPAADNAWFLAPVVYQANGDTISLKTNTDGANASLDVLAVITLPYPELLTDWVQLVVKILDSDGEFIDISDSISGLVNGKTSSVYIDSEIMQAGFVSFSLPPIVYDLLCQNPQSTLSLTFFHYTGAVNGIAISSESAYQTSQPVNDEVVYITGARRHGRSYLNQSGLQSRQLDSGESVSVRWRYDGDILSSNGDRFEDLSPEKILIVTAGEQTIRLNAVNLTLSGAGSALLSDDGQAMEQFGAESAVLSDGTVGYWGNGEFGGSGDADDHVRGITDAQSVYSNNHAIFNMATLCQSGQAVLWGDKHDTTLSYDDILSISATEKAFALTTGAGNLMVYGDAAYGGDSADVEGINDVERVYANDMAFAALCTDGHVIAWGDNRFGGDASSVAGITDIRTLVATQYAFAALRQDGSIVAWGDDRYGGEVPSGIADITALAGSHKSFVGLRSDGRVVAWGSGAFGAYIPDSMSSRNDIVSIAGCGVGFAAITDAGNVLAWGDRSIVVTEEVQSHNDIVSVVGNSQAFAALCRNGAVVTWGSDERGGVAPEEVRRLRDVVAVYAGRDNFTALTKEGNVYTWGGDPTVSLLQPVNLNGSVSYLNE